MELDFFQVDAFSESVFGGNPAAVIMLESSLEDDILQMIANENNLSETAFMMALDNGDYSLRWFTPTAEVDLCGHATLASAHVLFNYYNAAISINFITRSGKLFAEQADKKIKLDFPSRGPHRVDKSLYESLTSIKPQEVWESRDLMMVFNNEAEVIEIIPDLVKINEIDNLGVIVTAPGKHSDFVSRFFAPKVGVPEDPVTGSAHSTLVPYWSDRLGKTKLSAMPLSKRKGFLECELVGDRVKISGNSVTVIKGTFHL